MLRWFATVAPTLALLVWGSLYLADCLRAVIDSRKPLDVFLPTPKGGARLTASRWDIDWSTRQVVAYNVALYAPSGEEIARAEQVVASAPNDVHDGIVAWARNVHTQLERLPDGKWKHLDLLPAPTEEVGTTPYEVRVESSDVVLVDRTGADVWTRRVMVHNLRFAGIGKRLVVSFDLDLPGEGRLSGHMRKASDSSIGFAIETNRFEAGSIVTHLSQSLEARRYGFLRRCKATALAVAGRAAGTIPTNGAPVLTASFRAWGSNVAYGEDFTARTASFVGSAEGSGMDGKLRFTHDGGSGEFDGGLTWNNRVKVGGKAQYAVRDSASVPKWLRRAMPKQLKFTGAHFDGWFSYEDTGRFQVDGNVAARSGVWQNERLENANLRLLATNDRVTLKVGGADWLGGSVAGQIDVNLKSGQLAGLLDAKDASIDRVARRLGRNEVSGFANVQAVLGGTTASPEAFLRSQGTASVTWPKGSATALGNVQAAGHYKDGKLSVSRFAAVGPNGVVTAHGLWDSRTNRIDLNAFGNGISVAAVRPGEDGTALAQVHVFGPVANPKLTGRLEVVGGSVQGQTVPFAGGDVAWDGARWQASNVVATKGSTTVRGDIAWRPRDGSLDGRFSADGVALKDWVEGKYGGILRIPSATVGGTVGNLVADAEVEGESLAAQGVEIDSLKSHLSLRGSKIALDNTRLQVGKGAMTAEGDYDYKSGNGTASFKAEDLAIDRFMTAEAVRPFMEGTTPATTVTGVLNGDAEMKLANRRVLAATGKGTLKSASVNQALLGSGEWQANLSEGKWKASLFVGQLNRFIEIPNFEYDEGTREVKGDFTAFHLTVPNVLAGLSPLTKNAPADVAYKLSELDGAIDVNGSVSGQIDDPAVDLSVFKASALKLSEEPLGEIDVSAKRSHGIWTFGDVKWDSPDGHLSATGTIAEHGDVNLDGELTAFRLSKLSVLDPNLARLAGSADVPFVVNGPTGGPEIRASLKGRSFGLAGAEGAETGPAVFDLNLTSILVKPGSIEAEGGFVYRGITGTVLASVPFNYPFSIPDDRSLHAEVTLPKRPLDDLADYAPWMDAKGTAGSIEGSAMVDGVIGRLSTSGSINVSASTLAFKSGSKSVETSLHGVEGKVTLKDQAVAVDFTATGSKGGNLEAHFSTSKLDLTDILDSSTQRLLATAVSGAATFDAVNFGENWGKMGQVAFQLDGKLNVGGTLRAPTIGGSLAFSHATGVAPTEFAAATGSTPPTVNPRFDIALTLAEASRVRASTADFLVHGSGSLQGTLSRPAADMDLEVEKGSIRLPNAKIKIEEGGTMKFAYHVAQDGEGTPRLDIDLNGSTAVTALRFGDTLERYNISLRMTGNILEEGQMHIDAQSDPPDLSQERITAILQQSDLVQGLTKGPENALAGLALPAITEPITQRLATQLGLEYLSLEYDMFQRTTVTAASTLGGGFSIMGRRQISESALGPALYDFRLSYRLPTRNKLLRSFSIGIGMDQDRPWKITMEYGKRF